jgi:uncharacterized protein YoxC
MLAALILVPIVAAVARDAQQEAVTPVQKVLGMMDALKAKAIKEKQDEVDTMDKFKKFCHETELEKKAAIKKGGTTAQQLHADIEKYDSDVAVLSDEIGELDGSIGVAEDDKSKAQAVRDKDHADFASAHAGYMESIGDLGEAIQRVKSMMSSVSGASLIQTLSSKPHMPSSAKRVLTAFLQSNDNGIDEGKEIFDPSHNDKEEALAVSAPESATFESSSGGIVGMMEELKGKLSDEKDALEEDEAKEQHTFDMIAQELTDTIEEQSANRNKKSVDMKEKATASAQAKADLADTQATMASDTKYVEDMLAMCAQKESDFDARQTMRAEEIEAIEKAAEIIGSESVSGSADKHLPAALAQTSALVQLRSGSSQKNTQILASQFLSLQAKRLNSNLLASIAAKVTADPFGKIKKMISDMVAKLMEEATDEAEHKGFCDTEMGTNKQTRDTKTTAAAELSAQIEQMTAEINSLASDCAELSQEVLEIDEAMAKATEQRAEEKEKNTATIADAQAATAAVSQAMTVLKEFYAKASAATALTQMQSEGPADDAPETFDKPFTGVGGEGGIVGMLEVILSDFERLESDTTQAEATGESEFTQFSADSSKDKAVNNMDIKNKTDKKTKLEEDVSEAKGDLKSVKEELDAAMAYFEKLKPSCMDAGESYEDRVARRKAEIESLKEALKILAGEA